MARGRVRVSPWGDGMTWHVAPQGSHGEVPATRRARRARARTAAEAGSTAARREHEAAELVRTVDAAMLAAIEEEADIEARRQIMLQQARSAAERQRLEHTFAHERAQATQALLRAASEHEAAVRSGCAELKIASVDKLQALRSSSKPTLVHRGGRRELNAAAVPMESRNVPQPVETADHEVLLAFALRGVQRAARYAKVLPAHLPSKSNPSPFGERQRLRKGSYPTPSAPLPGRRSPYVNKREDPEVTVPFIRRPSAAKNTELLIIDSGGTTPLARSTLNSRESSREALGGHRSAPPTRARGELSSSSQEPLCEDPADPLRVSPEQSLSPGRFWSPRRSQSPYRERSSGSAARRMPSTSPLRAQTPVRRRISSLSLHSALSASLSGELSSRPGSTLTSAESKGIQWEEAAREAVGFSEPRGELYSRANASAAVAKASLSSTKRELIRHSVDLPSGSALGPLGQQRLATPQDSSELDRMALKLLSEHRPATSAGDRQGAGSKHHNRHHSFFHRAVPSRAVQTKQSKIHYDNVRLRTVISSQMDRIFFSAVADKDEQECNEKALGLSIAQLATNDATSALSLFPGILGMLFTILESSTSEASRCAVAEGLARLSRQAPVQEAIMTETFIRQGQPRRFIHALADLIINSEDVRLTIELAMLAANLCQNEQGFRHCSETGLLAALNKISEECEDPELKHVVQAAQAGNAPIVAQQESTSLDLQSSLSTVQLAEVSYSSIGTTNTRVSLANDPQTATEAGRAVPRNRWKPGSDMALPQWERPPDVIGVNTKLWRQRERKLQRPASSRHLE